MSDLGQSVSGILRGRDGGLPALDVQLMEQIVVLRDGQPVPELAAAPELERILLIAAALGPGPIPSQSLSDKALGKRKDTSDLRHCLADLTAILGGAYLPPSSGRSRQPRGMDVDLWRFRELVTSREEWLAPAIADALSRYHAPLQGWTDPWVKEIRDQVDRERHAAALWLAEVADRSVDHAGQLRHLETAATLEPACGHEARLHLLELYEDLGRYDLCQSLGRQMLETADPHLSSRIRRSLGRTEGKQRLANRGPSPGSGLPRRRPDLLERDCDCVEIVGKLRRHPLVTITGTAGAGKSALAQRVAWDTWPNYAQGAYFVPLGQIEPGSGIDVDAAQVAREVATHLSIPAAPDTDLHSRLADYLDGKGLLLVLDACEAVVGACRRLVESLASCERLKLIVTSEVALSVPGEARHEAVPLPLPKADAWQDPDQFAKEPLVRLYMRQTTGFVLTRANARALDVLCRESEGLPGRIAWAARALGNFETLDQLQARFAVHSDHLRLALAFAVAEQSSKGLDWRYHRLSSSEQLVFRRLGVFKGGCEEEAAQAVCSGGSGGTIPSRAVQCVFH